MGYGRGGAVDGSSTPEFKQSYERRSTRDYQSPPLTEPVRGIDDPDYRAALYACKRILTKLALIDDAPTSRLRQGPKPPPYAESHIPEGVAANRNLHAPNGHAPSKQFSLWAHYEFRIQRAAQALDAPTLLKLAACATRDYEIHMGRRTTHHSSHDSAVTELLRDCTGMPAIEASWWLDAPLKWVRRHRVLNGRDAELGEPTEQNERTRRVLALERTGATVRAIAAEVGLPKSQVQRILVGEAA